MARYSYLISIDYRRADGGCGMLATQAQTKAEALQLVCYNCGYQKARGNTITAVSVHRYGHAVDTSDVWWAR